MKRKDIIRYVLVLVFLITVIGLFAGDAPPDPGGDPQSGGDPPLGGGAPLNGGTDILFVLGAMYVFYKIYYLYKNKTLEELEE